MDDDLEGNIKLTEQEEIKETKPDKETDSKKSNTLDEPVSDTIVS